MKNKIEDLRNHLFATLEDLRDKEKPMDIVRAQAIANVGAVIVNSARAEMQFMKLTGSMGSGFIPEYPKLLARAAGEKDATPGVKVHRIKG